MVVEQNERWNGRVALDGFVVGAAGHLWLLVTSTYTAGERFSSGSVRAVLARRPGRHLMVKRSTRARFTGRPPSASVRLIPTFTPPAGHTAHDARRSSRVSVISRAGGKASQKKTIHIVQTGETALDDRREGGG